MNKLHLELLASPQWRGYVESMLLPWALGAADLGRDVLEIGPGPGLTTDGLRRHVDRLTAVEIDEDLATALAARMDGTNVTVLCADAARSGLPDGRFSGVCCFTMLHHVPSPDLQDALFAEAYRVLRPGGSFVGTDAIDTPALRELHTGDVFVPVDPDTLPDRLQRAGFAEATIDVVEDRVRFLATKASG